MDHSYNRYMGKPQNHPQSYDLQFGKPINRSFNFMDVMRSSLSSTPLLQNNDFESGNPTNVSFDFMDVIQNSLSSTPLPQNNGDVMEEFRRNGREVSGDVMEEFRGNGREVSGDVMEEFRGNKREVSGDVMEEFRGNGREVSGIVMEEFRGNGREVSAKKGLWCAFCKNNGETLHNYTDHKLKDNGKTVCPVLQMYVCPLCKATGPEAHTINYCPMNPNPLSVALMNMLKKRLKVGKPRYVRTTKASCFDEIIVLVGSDARSAVNLEQMYATVYELKRLFLSKTSLEIEIVFCVCPHHMRDSKVK